MGLYTLKLIFTPPNKALFDALAVVFGGRVSLRYKKGERSMVMGQVVIMKHNSYLWNLICGDAENLLRAVAPHSLLRQSEIRQFTEA